MARYTTLTVGKLNVEDINIGNDLITSQQTGYIPYYLKGANVTVAAPAAAYTTSTNAATALTVPANTRVLQVYTQVVTSATSTCAVSVGDSASINGWDAASNLKVAVGTRYAAIIGTDANAVGKLYSVQSNINTVVTWSNSADTVTFRVEALCVKEG